MNISERLDLFRKTNLAIIDFVDYLVLVSSTHNLTYENTNTFLHLAKSHLRAAITKSRAHTLGLHTTLKGARIVASGVEAREGVSSGISVADRTRTLQILGNSDSTSKDLVHPGHIFPSIIDNDYALLGTQETEAAYAHYLVSKLGERDPVDCVALFSLVLTSEGEAATGSSLAKTHNLPQFFASELIIDLFSHDALVTKVASANLPIDTPDTQMARIHVFSSKFLQGEHFAVTIGEITEDEETLVRVQNENLLTDIFAPLGSNSRDTLQASLRKFKGQTGIFVYLRNRYPNKLRDEVLTFSKPRRKLNAMKNFGIGAQIIRSLGARKISVLTTSDSRFELSEFGLEVVEQIKI